MKFCRYCGKQEDDDNALFCEKFGKIFFLKIIDETCNNP